MNKKIMDTIVVVLVSAFLTAAFTFLIKLWQSPKGEVVLGPILSVNSTDYFSVDVINYKDSPINDLKLSLPKLVDLDRIITSHPILLDRSISTENRPGAYLNRIILSDIESNTMTTILIPIDTAFNHGDISVINPKQASVKVVYYRNPVNQNRKILIESIVYACVYGVVLGVYFYLVSRRLDRSSEEIKDLKNDLDNTKVDLKKKAGDMEKMVFDYQRKYARFKVVTIRRLNDYSKELRFWRDTIRKVLGHKNSDICTQLIESVTEILKTYSTRSNIDTNLDFLEELALDHPEQGKEEGGAIPGE